MRLVVDSNIVFAGLLRDSMARRLLQEPPCELFCPEWMLVEIRSHRDDIARRAGIRLEELDALLTMLSGNMDIVCAEDYAAAMGEAETRMRGRDPGDVPFLALALSHACDGIWTHNTRDFADCGVEVWTTPRVLEWIKAHSVT